jgi:hypothetical protein
VSCGTAGQALRYVRKRASRWPNFAGPIYGYPDDKENLLKVDRGKIARPNLTV